MVDRGSRSVTVDRETTCPFLLRVFVKPGSHHEVDRDFQLPDRLPLQNESQLYAWKDTTLREICLQLLESSPSLMSNPPLKFSFKLVFLEVPRYGSSNHDGPIPRYKTQDLGTILSRDLAKSAPIAPSSGRSLQDSRFVVGDFIDVALISAHGPPHGTPSTIDQRPSFGIRGASRGFAAPDGPGSNSHEVSRWGRSSGAPPRWGGGGGGNDRRGSEHSRSSNLGRWGHNSTGYGDRSNGNGDRETDRYRDRDRGGKWGNSGNRHRRDSRSRSPSPGRRRR